MAFKTLHITNAWHASSGGIATFYRALLAAANRERKLLRLLVPAEKTEIEMVGEYGRIYHVASPRSRFDGSYRVIYPARYLKPGGDILRILNEERPDLIEVCDKFSLPFLAGLLRIGALPGVSFRPVTVGLSCERVDETFASYLKRLPMSASLARIHMKWAYFPMFDHHIVVSEHAAAELRDAARGHKVARATWISPMGVDADLFSPARRCTDFRRSLLARAGAGESSLLLLYAGRLAPEKNLGLLLDTLHLLRNDRRGFHLLIAGAGPSREPLEANAIQQLPGRVTFLGHLKDRMDSARTYANCDAFLHANPREPFGIGPLEAMASGLPLVAPNSGGLTTYANYQNAWLVKPDAQEFATAVRSVFSSSYDRILRTHSALVTASRYHWPAVAAAYLRLYAEIYAFCRGGEFHNEFTPSFLSTPGNWFGTEIG